MGSDFFERNKRKSLLAVLLLFLKGPGKFFVALLVAGAVSLPFVVSGERFSAILRSVGLGAMVSDSVPGSDNKDMLAAASSSAGQADSAKASFWAKYLRAANAPLPPAGSPSSMGMLRGGSDAGPAVVNDQPGEKPKGPGEVKGVVNADEKRRGEDAADVNLGNMFTNVASGNAGFGDLMGENLGDRHNGASNAPFVNKSVMSSKAGAADNTEGMYNNAVSKGAERVPAPSSPKRMNSKLGRVSAFSWKNLGRNTARSHAIAGMHNRTPMFQLSEAFTMGGLAYSAGTPEYEAAYDGATYDGNEVNADFLLSGEAPVVPDASFADDLKSNVSAINQQAIECSQAGGSNGAAMGHDGEAMKAIQDTLDYKNPPGCCHMNRVRKWNRKIRGGMPLTASLKAAGVTAEDAAKGLVGLCNDANANAKVLSQKCQVDYSPMSCNDYADMAISCNNPWDCATEIFAWIFMCAVLSTIVVVCMSTGLFGDKASQWIKGAVRKISGYDTPEAPKGTQNSGATTNLNGQDIHIEKED